MTGFWAGLLLLGVLIIVHELGHFLTAKLLGVRVLAFSVGFGPRLLGFSKGGTEYRLSAIPLGGYVKMIGESPLEELSEEDKKHGFLHQSIWKKLTIAFAGPFFNLLLPLALFFGIFWGQETVVEPVIGTVMEGDIADNAGLKGGDRIISIDQMPVSTFEDVVSMISSRPGKPLAIDVERQQDEEKPHRMQVVVVPRAEQNPNPLYQNEKVGRIGIMPAVLKPVVTVAHPDSAAAIAGINAFDEILEVDGHPVQTMTELNQWFDRKKNEVIKHKIARAQAGTDKKATIDVILPQLGRGEQQLKIDTTVKRAAVTAEELANPQIATLIQRTEDLIKEPNGKGTKHRGIVFAGTTIEHVQEEGVAQAVGLLKGDRIIAADGQLVANGMQLQKLLDVGPDGVHVLAVQRGDGAQIVAFRLFMQAKPSSPFAPSEAKVFGATLADVYGPAKTSVRHVGPIEASKRAGEKTWGLIEMTVKSVAMLVSREVPINQLGGPIMIFGVAGEAVSHSWAYYIFFMALISVNLGLLNLLPIPVLDGGHIMMFVIEAVRGKPLSIRTRQIATQVGFFLLLILMLIAIFNDVTRVFDFFRK